MDFNHTNIPRKKQFQTGSNSKPRKSVNGHTIVNVPTDRSRHNNVYLSNDDQEDSTYRDTNNHIKSINNPAGGSDSSSSRFSEGASSETRREQSDADRKVAKKRQQTKERLAEEQRNKRPQGQGGFSLSDAYEHASGGKTSKFFDGVRIDCPKTEKEAKIIESAKRGTSYRGTQHNASSFANLEGSGKKRGRGEREKQHDHSPFGSTHRNTSNYEDPLDEARYQQKTNNRYSTRGSHSSNEFTKKMGNVMNNIVQGKYGTGSMNTIRRKQKSKACLDDDVIDVDARTEGNGKKRKTSLHFESVNHSSDSPDPSSVNQGNDGFYVEGWENQDSAGHKHNEIMAALDGANQYVQPGNFGLKRDPGKNAAASRNRPAKSLGKAPIQPRFKTNQKDPIEEFSENESSAGQFGESKRRSNSNTFDWLEIQRNKGRNPNKACGNDNDRKKANKTKKKLVKMGMHESFGDFTDDEWKSTEFKSSLVPFATRRETRSKTRKAKKKDEVIEILDSSSEEESSDEEVVFRGGDESNQAIEATPKRPRPVGDLFSIDAARIAVGKKVFKSKCELKFQFGTKNQYMLFSWNNTEGKKTTHKVSLKQGCEEMKGFKYFVPEDNDNNEMTGGVDDSMTIIAFKIAPTKENQFTVYTKSYDDDSYVTVEFRDTDQFLAMLEQMRENQVLAQCFCYDPMIEFYDLKEYTAALLKDTEKENNNRRRSTRLSRANAKKKGNSSGKPLLVFPFKADEEEFCTAASRLNELKLAREPSSAVSGTASIQPQDSDLNEPQPENDKVKGSSRTHYITIRDDEIERLAPGEFLNDALVDFWMKWISGAPNKPNSDVHVFTSHFMSTLASDGVKAVSSWTAKKKIDIFEKKLIFVPVNSDLHWSLCVVVNPGSIASNYDNENTNSKCLEGSFLLFLDSLSMHRKNKIARSIYEWLNFEWKRLKKRGKAPDQPFTSEYMPVLTPKIPYQENGCDCGVFVCRYAYNLFQMRSKCFSHFDMADNCYDLFEECGLFNFDMQDIARIREEMESLIRNLSMVYLRIKKLEKAKKKINLQNDESTSSEKAGNSSTEVASAEETTEDGDNKSEGANESFDSNEDKPDINREDESDETPGEGNSFLSKEKENVENSSDTSRKEDELKLNEEQDDVSIGSDKSHDLLEDDQDSVEC